jgi:hypothetical protein
MKYLTSPPQKTQGHTQQKYLKNYHIQEELKYENNVKLNVGFLIRAWDKEKNTG